MDLQLVKSKTEDIEYIHDLEARAENRRFINPWTPEQHIAALTDPDIFHAVNTAIDRRVGFVVICGLVSPNRSIEFRR